MNLRNNTHTGNYYINGFEPLQICDSVLTPRWQHKTQWAFNIWQEVMWYSCTTGRWEVRFMISQLGKRIPCWTHVPSGGTSGWTVARYGRSCVFVCLFVHSLIYESSYPPILSVIHNTGRREKARQSFCSKDGLWTSPCLEEIFSTAEWPQLSVLLLLSVYMQKSRKDTRKLATGLSKKHYKFESLCRLTIQRLKIVVLHDLGWPHTFFLKCTQDYIIQWQII